MTSFMDNDQVLKSVIRSLHTIGAVVEVTWREYEGDSLVEKYFVVANPKWLADLLRSVVTVGGSVVRNGLIGKKQLIALWSGQYQCAAEPLVHLMSQLDVMVSVEDGEQFLIPCMLPDTKPDNVSLTCPDPRWTFRRSYFMTDEKAVPIGVMGKVIAISMRWGRIVTAWRDGCVVAKDDVWYSVRRQRVRQRVDGSGRSFMTDAVHVIMSANRAESSSSARSSFLRFRQLISNVLCEFYHVPHVEVIPMDDECADWTTLDDVLFALKSKKCMVTSHLGEQRRVDTLCSDLRVESMVVNIPAGNIRISGEIGRGSFGVVMKGELLPSPGDDFDVPSHLARKKKSKKESKKKKKKKAIPVAVKMIEEPSSHRDGSAEKRQSDKGTLLSTNWEIYLMSTIQHPNVVQLYGVCVEKPSPWLIMELMNGGDLLTALTDPLLVAKSLDHFWLAYDRKYSETLLQGAFSVSMGEFATQIDALRSSVRSSGSEELSGCCEQFLESAERHLNERTKDSFLALTSLKKRV
jgi:hypothetical protein